jgi:hypothetical protein
MLPGCYPTLIHTQNRFGTLALLGSTSISATDWLGFDPTRARFGFLAPHKQRQEKDLQDLRQVEQRRLALMKASRKGVSL